MPRLLLLLPLVAVVAAQAVFVPVSVEELCGMSDVIADATVNAVGPARENAEGKLETPVRMAVAAVLKGPAPLNTLTVIEPGGALNGRQEVYYNQLIPTRGERYILFLRRAGADYVALGGLHGHYRVVDGRIQVHPAMPRILKTGFANAPVAKLIAEVEAELGRVERRLR